MQFSFGSYFCTYSFGNQYKNEWKLTNIFAEMVNDSSGWSYIKQGPDQQEKVYDFYQMQSETESVVSKDENLERKD